MLRTCETQVAAFSSLLVNCFFGQNCFFTSEVVSLAHKKTRKKDSKHGHHEEGAGIDRKLHDPVADRLIPLEPLDLGKIQSIDDLVRAMSKTAFTGRQLGEAADVLEAMARDQECFVVMTLAGAMTVAKQGLVIAELIDRGIVNAIVSTGALMAHGLVEATGARISGIIPSSATRNFTRPDTTASMTRSNPSRISTTWNA
jgi:hypothetical protein